MIAPSRRNRGFFFSILATIAALLLLVEAGRYAADQLRGNLEMARFTKMLSGDYQ